MSVAWRHFSQNRPKATKVIGWGCALAA